MEKIIAFSFGVVAAVLVLWVPNVSAVYVTGAAPGSTAAVQTWYGITGFPGPFSTLGALVAQFEVTNVDRVVCDISSTILHAAHATPPNEGCDQPSYVSSYAVVTSVVCPTGYTYQSGSNNCLVGSSSLGCDAGFFRSSGQPTMCTDARVAAGGACNPKSVDAVSTPYDSTYLGVRPLCMDDCGYEMSSASNQYSFGGVQQWVGVAVSTGQACVAGAVAPSHTVADVTCPVGQAPQTINGVTSCFAASTSNLSKTVTTTFSVSGGVVTAVGTINTDSGVGVGTQTVTQVGSGSQVVTSGGTSTVPKTTFCQDNPTSQICTNTIMTETTGEGILSVLNSAGTAPTDQTAKTGTDIQGLMPDLSGITGWTFPARSVSCPLFTLDLTAKFGAGGNYTFSSFCTLANSQASNISAVMLVIWTLLAVMIVLSA